MSPVMPLDVQWFIYALVSNEAVSQADAQTMYESLGPGAGLQDFAQLVLDRLVEGMSEEDAQSVANQVQDVMDYAVEQSQTVTGTV